MEMKRHVHRPIANISILAGNSETGYQRGLDKAESVGSIPIAVTCILHNHAESLAICSHIPEIRFEASHVQLQIEPSRELHEETPGTMMNTLKGGLTEVYMNFNAAQRCLDSF